MKTLQIGIALSAWPLKDRVKVFLERYGTSDKIDVEYTYVREGRYIRAVLKAPLLDRTFEGGWASDEFQAKQKVWEVFYCDPEVVEITRKLPPPQSKIKEAIKKMPIPWKELREVSHIDHGQFVRELVHYVSCSSATWKDAERPFEALVGT